MVLHSGSPIGVSLTHSKKAGLSSSGIVFASARGQCGSCKLQSKESPSGQDG
jgi:hypothetical protein